MQPPPLTGGQKNQVFFTCFGGVLISDKRILFDWFTLTSKVDSVNSLVDLLGLTDAKWIPSAGFYGYHGKVSFGNIHIHFDNPNYPGVMLDMSGSGCRSFDEYGHCDWSVLFQLCNSDPENYHVTRLDIAFDDRGVDGVLPDMAVIVQEVRSDHYCTRFQKGSITESVKGKGGITVYFGSNQSELCFRIYDKAKERAEKVDADADDLGHWVRFEITLRRDRAAEFIKLPYDQLGSSMIMVINNYLRFTESYTDPLHRCRAKTADWWLGFVETLDKISLYTPTNTEYSLDKAKAYVYGQAGNSVSALIDILGVDQFLKELKENKPAAALKYKHLVAVEKTKKTEEMLNIIGDLSEWLPIGTDITPASVILQKLEDS